MSDERLNIGEEPTFSTNRIVGTIPQIRTYELMDHELDTLSESTDEELTSLGFFTGAVGALVSCIVAWATIDTSTGGLGPSVLTGLTGLSVLVAIQHGVKWRKARQKRRKSIQNIRERSVLFELELDGRWRRIKETDVQG